ncbi:MAG: trigger factor [Oligoflexia bacterium]|nr:trigger factor [Oligoflexia bacterium]
MKSEVTKLDGLKRRLQVEVPPEVVSMALENQYKQVQQVAALKGFRKGKVPLAMVKTEYRSRVEQEVVSQLIQDHYGKALDQHALDPVNFPEIQFESFQEGQPLKFSATFEIRPEVNLKSYTGLEVQKEKLEVKSELLESILEDIRKSKANMVPLIELRPAAMGDVAVIDFHGRVDDKDLPGGSGQEYLLELGAKQFIEGFEEGVVGMNPGDTKILNLSFPQEYHAKDIAGKAVEFKVTLKEIKKKTLPELNDELAKAVGHDSLQHLKEEITKDITSREEKRIRDDLKNRVLHALVEKNPIEVPQSLVAKQKEVIIEDVHHRMENQGMTHEQFDEYKVKWDADFQKSAEFVIRSSLLVSAIAKKEGLSVNESDIEQRFQDYAQQTGIEIEKIKAHYSKPEARNRLSFQMTEDKVMALLLDKAKVTEVSRDKLKPLN